jgi:putative transposase
MPNHVHFAVQIKNEEEIAAFISDRVSNSVRDKNDKPLKIGTPSQQFAKLFNSYAQSYNKWVEARGSLFERPFKRKQVENIQYLKRLIIYIHQNPVHHGFCSHPLEYPWSSYLTCTSDKATKLKRDEVIEWFGGKEEYEAWHRKKMNMDSMDWAMGV